MLVHTNIHVAVARDICLLAFWAFSYKQVVEGDGGPEWGTECFSFLFLMTRATVQVARFGHFLLEEDLQHH